MKCLLFQLQCLSGSSDGTIKLWHLGHQRCLATYKIHDEGVWTLASDEHLSYFYSSGKDRKVFYTDLRTEYERTYFLFQEKAPVLSVSLPYGFHSLNCLQMPPWTDYTRTGCKSFCEIASVS